MPHEENGCGQACSYQCLAFNHKTSMRQGCMLDQGGMSQAREASYNAPSVRFR